MTAALAGSGLGAEGRGRLVTVLGGTGFLGRRVVQHLLDRGFRVRAAVRHPERASPLFGPNDLGAEAVDADVHDEASVIKALADAFGVVNTVSLYVERGGRETFRAVHVEGAARIARLSRQAGIGRLIHVSGIGADPASPSSYIRARGTGEVAVREAFPGVTLVRPSVMFGANDYFLTALARLLRTLPVYPLFGRGRTRLQPVHVEDVGEAIARILGGAAGGGHLCYEFGGPSTYTYAELVGNVADRIGTRPWLVPLPFVLWEAVAFLSEFAPSVPLTRNQVALMRRDNVGSPHLPGLRDLHIAPTALEDILATISAGGRATQQ